MNLEVIAPAAVAPVPVAFDLTLVASDVSCTISDKASEGRGKESPIWVRNAWYVAGWSHDLPPGIIQSRTICNEPIVLYRKSNGTPVVFEDRCCHRLAPLSKGRLEGDDLRCMYHGLKFAPDGRCIEIPGQVNIPAKAAVKSYPVVEHGSWIWVWPGDAARADVYLLPETIATSDADWQIETGFLDYAAHYQLINDNLLDLLHLSFVHAKTLGRGTPQWANQRPNIIPLPRGVRFQRWFENCLPAHYMAGRGDAFDMWHSYDFLVPGLFIQRPAWFRHRPAHGLQSTD